MTDIVKAPPFMPSKPQWDATVKLLERALEELAQAQAERDAARAKVARMTADVDRMADMLRVCECGHHAVSHEGRRLFCNMKGCECAALRQPAPARAQTWCECGHKWSDHSDIGCVNCGCGEPAPATGEE